MFFLLIVCKILRSVAMKIFWNNWYFYFTRYSELPSELSKIPLFFVTFHVLVLQAQVLYDFDPQAPEELQLVADEYVTIVNQVSLIIDPNNNSFAMMVMT